MAAPLCSGFLPEGTEWKRKKSLYRGEIRQHDLSQVTGGGPGSGTSWRRLGPMTRCDGKDPSPPWPSPHPNPRPPTPSNQEKCARHIPVQGRSLKSQTSPPRNGQVHQKQGKSESRRGLEEVKETRQLNVKCCPGWDPGAAADVGGSWWPRSEAWSLRRLCCWCDLPRSNC